MMNEQPGVVIISRDSMDQMTSSTTGAPEAPPPAPPMTSPGITARPSSSTPVPVKTWTRNSRRSATLARLQRKPPYVYIVAS